MLAFLLAFQASVPQAPVLLRVDPAVGQRIEYDMATSIRITKGEETQTADIGFLLAERAVRVGPDEIVWSRYLKTTRQVAKGAEMRALVEMLASLSGKSYRSVTNRSNTPSRLAMDGIEVPSDSSPDVVFSKAPVAVGETWEGSYGNANQVRARYTLLGFAEAGGRRAAIIGMGNVAAPSPGGYIFAPGAAFAIDVKDGRWLKASVKLTQTPSSGLQGEVTYTILRRGIPGLDELKLD